MVDFRHLSRHISKTVEDGPSCYWPLIRIRIRAFDWYQNRWHWMTSERDSRSLIPKISKYSLLMTPTPCRVAGCIISIRPMYSCAGLLTYYLYSWLGTYKTDNISETVKNRAKVSINVLYKVVHGLSIAAKIMYDLGWPLSEIQGH